MKYKRIENKIILRIDKGEEVIETLKKVCADENVKVGQVNALGAVNKVKIGLFNVETKEYHAQEFVGNFEIAPLYGNISTMNGELYLHLHINICNSEHKSFGGHLNYAYVSATCECIIEIIEGEVEREFSEEIGLNLFKI